MSRIPSLSRRVVDALAGQVLPFPDRRADTTAVGRAFITLLAARERQAAALDALDRIVEISVNWDAGDPELIALQASADRSADEVAALAASLLLAPVSQVADLRCKLAVLIAACEPHPADAYAFPGLYLRVILADLGHDHSLPHRQG